MKWMAGVSLHTRLTLRYGLALAVVGMLTLASYGLMQNAVGTEVLGAKLLNVAGRQRMLCQRVEILAMRAQREADAERQARLSEMDRTLKELAEGHELLVHGPAKDLGIEEGNPALKVLRADDDGAEVLFHRFLAESAALRRNLADTHGPQDVASMRRISLDGDALLQALDQRMSTLERLGESTLGSFSRLIVALMIAALGGLLLTGLAVLRPMVAEVVRDREQLESLNRSLETQASTDKLTGAYNRRTWDVEIGREFSKARRQGMRLSLVMTDLDFFKRVNDEHGHQRGDLVLQAFTERLRQAIRASDTLFRLGGEEFAVLLPGTGIEQGRVTAEKLRESVAKSPLSGLAITASFGVAETDGDESPDELFRRADQALYAAKAKGRNRVEIAEKETG